MIDPFIQCKSLFETKNKFILTTHVNPDGDALGSEIALAIFLKNRGKDVAIINQSETPSNYKFLCEKFPVFTYDEALHHAMMQTAECLIVLDTNTPKRFFALAGSYSSSSAVKICIDHHADPEQFADLYLTDISATSTGEIVYKLIQFIIGKANNFTDETNELTLPIAEALYVAIITDTGSFRFSSTDYEIHLIIAHLLRRGANPSILYQKIYEEGSVTKLKLLGRAIDSIRLEHGGTVAAVIIRQRDFAETGAVEADTDNMVNYPMTIGGVLIALMFVEIAEGIKVSLRSKGEIPVNELAKEFGGNGHRNAAGIRLQGSSLGMIYDKIIERGAAYLPAAGKHPGSA